MLSDEIDRIEWKVGQGQMNACKCFTKMREVVNAETRRANQIQAEVERLREMLRQLTVGLPEILESGDLKDEEGLIRKAETLLSNVGRDRRSEPGGAE